MNTPSVLLALGILATSFWGSWHCAAMCGPIASVAASQKGLGLYHFGRLLGYVSLGLAGGAIGQFFLDSEFTKIRWVAGFIFSLVLIFSGWWMVRGQKQIQLPGFSWLHKFANAKTPAFTLGALSLFLPCGWLYTYVLAAAATKSPMAGGLVMGLFWLGGLPALSAVSVYMRSAIGAAPAKKQKVAGLVLVGAGLYSLISFYFLGPLY